MNFDGARFVAIFLAILLIWQLYWGATRGRVFLSLLLNADRNERSWRFWAIMTLCFFGVVVCVYRAFVGFPS